MPRISGIELLKTPDQPALTIRTRTSVDRLPMLIGQGYGRIGAYLGSLGEHPANVPFVAYHNMDMADLDVELGFPVSSPLPGNEDIQYAPVPGGLRAFCMYLGPYSQMAPVYGELAAWILASGFTSLGTAYEHYFNGPDTPEEQLLTQIVMPVK
jgi:effector-binding domain-containing protein